MKRLLCIVGSMDVGGAETFLMKIYRTIDRKKYQMDFCVAKKEKNFYEDEILRLGGKLYRITPKTKNPLKNFHDIKKIVKKNNYKSVLRVSQHSLSSLELLAAKFGGANKLVFRSSNSNSGGSKFNMMIHFIFRPFANLISNVKIAPSKEAGDFMFGEANYLIVNNGLDLNEYRFSVEKRKKYRKEFNVRENTMVVGHVGRFNYQKNHKFLIEIFEKYHKINDNSELWLFGKGELEQEIKQIVNEKKLTKYVKFLGVREDINYIYSAMDCYIFPSIFEGMPNTVIEAQTSGLPCVVSDAITKDCGITEYVSFVSNDQSAERWSDIVKKNSIIERENSFVSLKKNQYGIDEIVKIFEKVVF